MGRVMLMMIMGRVMLMMIMGRVMLMMMMSQVAVMAVMTTGTALVSYTFRPPRLIYSLTRRKKIKNRNIVIGVFVVLTAMPACVLFYIMRRYKLEVKDPSDNEHLLGEKSSTTFG